MTYQGAYPDHENSVDASYRDNGGFNSVRDSQREHGTSSPN